MRNGGSLAQCAHLPFGRSPGGTMRARSRLGRRPGGTMRARSRHLQRRGPSVGGGHPLLGIPRQPQDTVTLQEALRSTRETATVRLITALGQLQEDQRFHPRERLHPRRARATCRTSRVLLTVMTPLLVSGGPWKSPLTSCPAKHLQEILRVPYFDGSVPKNMAIILIILRVSRARYLRAKLVEKQYDAIVRRGRKKFQTKGKW